MRQKMPHINLKMGCFAKVRAALNISAPLKIYTKIYSRLPIVRQEPLLDRREKETDIIISLLKLWNKEWFTGIKNDEPLIPKKLENNIALQGPFLGGTDGRNDLLIHPLNYRNEEWFYDIKNDSSISPLKLWKAEKKLRKPENFLENRKKLRKTKIKLQKVQKITRKENNFLESPKFYWEIEKFFRKSKNFLGKRKICQKTQYLNRNCKFSAKTQLRLCYV